MTNSITSSKLYLISLSSIALLTIIGQFFLQGTVTQSTIDTHVTSLATRQLQLSEHLSKTALIIQFTQDYKTRTGYVEEFRNTLDLWERTHTGLQGGDASLGLSGDNSIPITNLFADLLQRYWNMDTIAKNFLVIVDQDPFYSALPAEVSTLVNQLLAQDAAFSPGMKAIVLQYQKEDSEHLNRLKQLSFLLSSLLLIVLLLEGIYLFHPTLQQLEQTLQELVATKQLVRQQANWLQGILNNLPAFISLKDTQGRYLVVNRPFAKFLHSSAEEVKGKTDHDFFHSQLATELQAHDRKVLETNLSLEFEEVIPQSDGPHTYLSIKFPLSNGTNPYALCNIATDLTASQQMADSLQECEAMFRIFLQAIPQTTLIIDPTGIILTANQTAAQRLGVTLEKLIGANIYESLPQAITNTRRTTINEAIDTHQPIQFQEEHEGRPIDNCVYPVAPRGKATSKLIIITYNVTDPKPVLAKMSEADKPTPMVSSPPSQGSLETTSRKVNSSLPSVEDFTKTTQFRMITKEGKMLWLRDSAALPYVPAKASSPTIRRSEAPPEAPQTEDPQHLRERVITSICEGLVIADATQPDMPVIYVNPAFERLTGYTATDVLGRNCRFLYRGEKNQPALLEMRAALAEGRNCQVILRNYRKDGSLFWNQLSLSPLYDTTGQLTHFVGIQIDITPQKQAEENLRLSEERYRRIVDTAQEGIWLLDADAKTTFVNQSLADMLGYRSNELLGHSLFEFMDAATAMTARQHFGQGQPGISEKYDFRFLRQDGAVLWTIISINPLIDEQGKFLGALGMVIDITQRKQVEAALRDSENKFRSLTERVAAAILICQGERLVYANPAATLLTGYTPAELSQMRFWELVHPDFQAMVKEQGLARQRGDNPSSRYELKILTSENQERWLDLTAHSVEYQGEQAILATAFDITERKQAEETLRNIVEGVSARTGENFLKSLVEYLATSLQVKYAIVGQLLAETPYKMMTLFVVGDHQLLENFEYDLRNTPCEKLLTGDTPCCSYPQHVQQLFPDNPLLVKLGIDSCVGTPLFNSNGKVVGLMAIMDDKPLSHSQLVESMLQIFAARASAELERLQALEALQQERTLLAQRVQERTAELTMANTELARATRLKHEFLANMRHELRTPLNTIITISEALQHQIYGEINSQQTEKIHSMEDSGHHLLDLINDILDLAKIEAGKLKLEILPVSVQGISNACGRLTKTLADKKHITFTITLDNTVTNIQADDRYLKKILLHLLDNAVKFTPKDGAINLTISGNQQERMVYLTVSDTGKGIPEEQLPYLFKLFEQLDGGLAREHGGSGLGLFLVSRLAEMHGGYVTVASEVGNGSRFTVAVPWQSEEVKEIDNS
jgi:PAS domain S-box-containing protein